MHASAVLTSSLAAFASAVCARPGVKRASSAAAPPMQLSALEICQVPTGNTSISFTVYDPDPLTNSSAVCSGAWPTNSSGYPQGPYVICGNSSFAWNFGGFNSLSDFTLDVEHEFIDPAVGPAPYDSVLDFSRAVYNSSTLDCNTSTTTTRRRRRDGAGALMTCVQEANVVYAPVYATVAKK